MPAPKDNELAEAYWMAKHPPVIQFYNGRPLPGTKTTFPMDVRRWIWAEDGDLADLGKRAKLGVAFGMPIDVVALGFQRWVVKNIRYIADTTLGVPEYWQFPGETWRRGRGDCEDGGLLMAGLILNAIPMAHHWRVRPTAGMVKTGETAPDGGHLYLTYCRESDNEWVVLDWCYLEDSRTPMEKKPLLKDRPEYRDPPWFSMDRFNAYSYKVLSLAGRLHGVQVTA